MLIYFSDDFEWADKSLSQDHLAVANDVLKEFAALLGNAEPPAGNRDIVLYHRHESPLIDSTADLTLYQIYLTVSQSGRFYCNFVYQLAHELGHLYLDPRRSDFFLETFAVAFSHKILHQMAKRWSKHSHPPWRSYHYQFMTYSADVINEALRKLDLHLYSQFDQDFRLDDRLRIAEYLSGCKLADRGDDRDLQTVGALSLLLAGDELDWTELVGLGSFTTPDTFWDPKFRSDLHVEVVKFPEGLAKWLGCSKWEIEQSQDQESTTVPKVSVANNETEGDSLRGSGESSVRISESLKLRVNSLSLSTS